MKLNYSASWTIALLSIVMVSSSLAQSGRRHAYAFRPSLGGSPGTMGVGTRSAFAPSATVLRAPQAFPMTAPSRVVRSVPTGTTVLRPSPAYRSSFAGMPSFGGRRAIMPSQRFLTAPARITLHGAPMASLPASRPMATNSVFRPVVPSRSVFVPTAPQPMLQTPRTQVAVPFGMYRRY